MIENEGNLTKDFLMFTSNDINGYKTGMGFSPAVKARQTCPTEDESKKCLRTMNLVFDEQTYGYIRNVVESKAFKKNPSSYVKKWKKYNEKLDDNVSKTAGKFFKQLYTSKTDSLSAKDKELSEFLRDVFSDRKFKNNPSDYVKGWRESRGGFEFQLFPADPALHFFERLYP